MRTVCKAFIRISFFFFFLLMCGFFFCITLTITKSKTEKQLSQRAQLCCILLGLCAPTAVTKVFEPICFFFHFVSLLFLSCSNGVRMHSHYDIRHCDRVVRLARIELNGETYRMVVSLVRESYSYKVRAFVNFMQKIQRH